MLKIFFFFHFKTNLEYKNGKNVVLMNILRCIFYGFKRKIRVDIDIKFLKRAAVGILHSLYNGYDVHMPFSPFFL